MNILLVEDHDDQALVIERVLSRHGSEWQVTVVGSGQACLDRLASTPYPIIILDYYLPDMTGLDALVRIRELQPESSVVIVTGHGDEKIAVDSMKQGAADYLTKSGQFLSALPTVVEKVVEQGRLKRELADSQRRFSQLSRISLDLSIAGDLDLAAQIVADGARQLTRSGVGLALFLDPATGLVERIRTSGLTLHEALPRTSIEGRGLLGIPLAAADPAVFNGLSEQPNPQLMPAHTPTIESAMVLPIRIQRQTIGLILVGNPDPGYSYRQPEHCEALLSLALHAAGVIRILRSVEDARRQAITDGLTGLYNHRECQRRLGEELERAQRYARVFSLLMVDVDYFKIVNDSHGHQVGDLALQQVARGILKQLRQVDIASRYGGEEFLVILPETDGVAAGRVADRIVEAIAACDLGLPSGPAVPLSVSIGVASFPEDGEDRESLIAAADHALYVAKESGRNRACPYRRAAQTLVVSEEEIIKALVEDPTVNAVKRLAATVDARSAYTRGHSAEVTQYAMAFAEHLALTDEQKDGLRIAGLLHNLGSVSVPDRILAKPGPLTDEERKVIQAHPGLAELLGREAPRFKGVAQAILYHHERWDGHGYPRGLSGEEIPRLARILGLVEAYHAMTSARPYRRRLSRDEAVRELRAGAGTQFDPHLVERFIESLPSRASEAGTAPCDEAA